MALVITALVVTPKIHCLYLKKKKDISRLGTQVHSDTDTPDSYTDTPWKDGA